MKKIIITGGIGYIGMELSKIYSGKSRNFDITVLDNKFYSERVSQLKRWGIKFEQVDILDEDNLQKHIGNADLIYHLIPSQFSRRMSHHPIQSLLNSWLHLSPCEEQKNMVFIG